MEDTYQDVRSCLFGYDPGELTIGVTNVVVEVNLSVTEVTVGSTETSLEDVAVLNADIFSGKVERHFDMDWEFGNED